MLHATPKKIFLVACRLLRSCTVPSRPPITVINHLHCIVHDNLVPVFTIIYTCIPARRAYDRPSLTRYATKCGSLDVSQHYGPRRVSFTSSTFHTRLPIDLVLLCPHTFTDMTVLDLLDTALMLTASNFCLEW
jgi:hypothetical protein